MNRNTLMISLPQVNAAILITMFLVFVFTSKFTALIGLKIVGLEYFIWGVFSIILITIHFRQRLTFKSDYLVLFALLISICSLNYFFVDVPALRYFQGTFFTFLFAINFLLFYNIK